MTDCCSVHHFIIHPGGSLMRQVLSRMVICEGKPLGGAGNGDVIMAQGTILVSPDLPDQTSFALLLSGPFH